MIVNIKLELDANGQLLNVAANCDPRALPGLLFTAATRMAMMPVQQATEKIEVPPPNLQTRLLEK